MNLLERIEQALQLVEEISLDVSLSGKDALDDLQTILYDLRAALTAQAEEVVLDIADTCDGKEQDAFEAWASANGYDMTEHPLHYLFLDPKTYAARQGWREGINYARNRLLISQAQALKGATDEP